MRVASICVEHMPDRLFDDPIRSALPSLHRDLALSHGDVVRYPAAVASFLGVTGAAIARASLDALVQPGEKVYVLGPEPALPDGWSAKAAGVVFQMLCPATVPGVAGPAI